MKKLALMMMSILLLAGCESAPFKAVQGLFGYIPPPPVTTVGEELRLEFARCEKIDPNRNCAQIAYDVVRTVKGLEPRKVPKGVVIILEGNVEMEEEKKDGKNESSDDGTNN
jgi:hypothetical protein